MVAWRTQDEAQDEAHDEAQDEAQDEAHDEAPSESRLLHQQNVAQERGVGERKNTYYQRWSAFSSWNWKTQ